MSRLRLGHIRITHEQLLTRVEPPTSCKGGQIIVNTSYKYAKIFRKQGNVTTFQT